MVDIRRVTTRGELLDFIRFPHRLYKGNPYWCPPLRMDELNTLDSRKNKAFDFCEAAYWMAYRNHRMVGRIAGIINRKANEKWEEYLVRFGWIDFTDDPEVSDALIKTVEEWGKNHGMKGIQGPLGFTDMDKEGMMLKGFDELSNLSSIYNYAYYPVHMERMGFVKAADWVQYEFDISSEVPEKVERLARTVRDRYNLHMLRVRKTKELLPYARRMFCTLNKAFDNLYGFASLTEKQMDAYTRQYFGFIRPEFVSIVLNWNEDVVGFGISMPSLTKALQMCNGRLFPFGWFNILQAIRKNNVIDMYLVGVHPDYQGKGIAAMVWQDLHKAYLKYGIRKAVSNPQLENNIMALSIWKNYKGKQIIRRRCWIKYF